MFIVQLVTEHLFHWTSTDINTKIKLMLVQNYGWPTGPAKIWLWLARRPFGWPRATGPAGSTTPAFRVMIILRLLLLLTNLHLKLLSTQGTGADKLLSTQRVNSITNHRLVYNDIR